MHLHSWLLWAVALAGSTNAFYPYKHSKGLQGGDVTTSNEERGYTHGKRAGSTAIPKRGSVKLTVKRKPHPSHGKLHHRSTAELNAIDDRRRERNVGDQAASLVKRHNDFGVATAAKPSHTNSLPIDQDGTDFSYFAPIPFGSKDTMMYMLIDTGAANTWLMGSNCTTKACEKHNTFGEADSTTFKASSDKFKFSYGTGSVSGVTANDTVQIAGMSIPLSFGAASTTSDDFLDYPMDGILGLGRSASNTMKFPTAMEAIMSAKDLQGNLFGINLQRESDGATDGEISFGAPDETKYTGDLFYSDTISGGKMWEIPMDDVGFNGHFCKFTGKSAVIDTGTTFMLLPPDDSKKLHSLIPGSQQDGEVFDIPCSTKQPVQVVISGVSYNISSKDYIGKATKGGKLCKSNIVGKQAFTADTWLLGDVFLKNVYSVFDFDKDRIGFGVKVENSTTTKSDTASGTTKPTLVGSTTASVTSSSASPTNPTSDSKPSNTSSSGAMAAYHVPIIFGVFSMLLPCLLILT